jgi:hypothetical protein
MKAAQRWAAFLPINLDPSIRYKTRHKAANEDAAMAASGH